MRPIILTLPLDLFDRRVLAYRMPIGSPRSVAQLSVKNLKFLVYLYISIY